MPSVAESGLYRGHFIGTFHLSHFYPVDGNGHWWVEADEETWPQVWTHGVGDPPVVTVYMEVEGELQPNVATELTSPEGDVVRVPQRGATPTKLVIRRIESITPVPADDFNGLAGISDD